MLVHTHISKALLWRGTERAFFFLFSQFEEKDATERLLCSSWCLGIYAHLRAIESSKKKKIKYPKKFKKRRISCVWNLNFFFASFLFAFFIFNQSRTIKKLLKQNLVYDTCDTFCSLLFFCSVHSQSSLNIFKQPSRFGVRRGHEAGLN